MLSKNKGKLNSQSKFNTPIESSPFLKNFQALLLEKLIMIKDGTYSKAAMRDAIARVATKGNDINMNIDPIRITCDLEPEVYWWVQETAKKVTGEVIPMDRLVYLLLTYFVSCYANKRVPKKLQPFMRVNPSQRLDKLSKFKLRFGRYFKNHVERFPEQIDKREDFR